MPCGYSVLVVNAGSKNNETGEFNPCVIDSFVVKINGVVDNVQTVTYLLEPFDYVEFWPYQTTLPSGAHNLTVEVFEAGVEEPLDISTTTVFATVREDLNYDIYVGIDDIITVAEAFGSSPLIYHDIRDPRWDPRCDFNNDDYVGIDDIVSAAEAFGTP